MASIIFFPFSTGGVQQAITKALLA